MLHVGVGEGQQVTLVVPAGEEQSADHLFGCGVPIGAGQPDPSDDRGRDDRDVGDTDAREWDVAEFRDESQRDRGDE